MVVKETLLIVFFIMLPLIIEASQWIEPSASSATRGNETGVAQCLKEDINKIKKLAKKIRGRKRKAKALRLLDNLSSKAESCAASAGTSACSSGWVSYGKSCYLVIDTPTLKWSDARRNCQKLGGDLAKITSAGENRFILDLISKQKTTTAWGAWLGLHRKIDTKFYWADDTPLSGYTAWAAGEPNTLSEKCGHMFGPPESRPGEWNDNSCSIDKRYLANAPVIVCQKASK